MKGKNDRYYILVPRVVLVPGITATKENLTDITELFVQNRIGTYEFLTYNSSGIDKLIRLGKAIPEGIPDAPLSAEVENNLIDFFHKTLANKMETITFIAKTR